MLFVVCDSLLFVFVAACASPVCCSSLVIVAGDVTVLFLCVLVVLLCCVIQVGVKAGKDKYPFKQPHFDTLRNVVDS